MKKTVLTMLCLMAMSASYAQTTKRIMTVQQKDGTKVEYKVDNVERVSFSERTYADLDNQWALNENVNDVKTVLLKETDGYSSFMLYSAENVTSDLALNPDVAITLPAASVGQDVDLAALAEAGGKLVCGDREFKKGALKVKFDKFKKNVTVTVEAEDGADDFRCEYTGTFSRTYDASNTFSVTDTEQATTRFSVLSALCVQPSATGEPTNFAFADVEAQAPADFLNAKAAVWFSVSAAKLYNGTVDMATEADSYTFRYFQHDGKGSLRMENGTVFQPNDRYLLENEKFRLYYTSASTETQTLTVVVEDNFGKSYEMEFSFNDTDEEEEFARSANKLGSV